MGCGVLVPWEWLKCSAHPIRCAEEEKAVFLIDSPVVKDSYQVCVAFGYQGGLPVNRAEHPIRLHDKCVTYGLQIRAQWACYCASASDEITVYYCRRQRINKHNIWGSISSGACGFSLPPSQTSRYKQA